MEINLLLQRLFLRDHYTIGKLYVNSDFFSHVLEDKVREFGPDGEGKVKGETAIPYGEYEVIIADTTIKQTPEYVAEFGQKLPLLLNVPFFEGIRIHAGNTDIDTHGCLLVGVNDITGQIHNSQATLKELMRILTDKDVTKIKIKII